MLNSIGLANPGREQFLAVTLPQLRTLGVPLWVSVGGFAAAEYAETCALLTDVTIELNLSCPNVDEAPEGAAEIVAACRAATSLPLYAKLSPHAWDIGETVRAVEAAGADGISLVNTLRGVVTRSRAPAAPRDRRRGVLRTGAEARRAGRGSRRATRDRACRSSAWEGCGTDATHSS